MVTTVFDFDDSYYGGGGGLRSVSFTCGGKSYSLSRADLLKLILNDPNVRSIWFDLFPCTPRECLSDYVRDILKRLYVYVVIGTDIAFDQFHVLFSSSTR